MLKSGKKLLLLVTALVVTATAASAQERKSDGDCGPAKSHVEASLENQMTTPGHALTVRLEPTAHLSAGLGSDSPIRLCVEVKRPPLGVWKGLRVFLNAADANARTPTNVPNYVGSFAFYGGAEGETQSFMLNLGRAVRRLKQAGHWPAGEPLVLTLVPIPSAQSASGAVEGIRVTKVTVAAPE